MKSLREHGFDGNKIAVTVSMFFAQLGIGLIGIPLAIEKLTAQIFALIDVVSGGPLGFAATYSTNKILGMASAPYIELNELLAMAKNGYVTVDQIRAIKPEKFVKADLGTSTEIDALRGAIFMGVQILLMIAIYFVLRILS